jgi:DNA polymerase-3 subunit delta
VVWGDDAGERLASALEDVGAPALFGGGQVLVVRRAEALRDEEQERVLRAIPSLGAGGALILVSRSSDQRKKVFAACTRAGAAIPFAPVDARTAQGWVVRLACEQGGAIASAAAADLVDRTGTDLSALAQEVAKLVMHAGPGRTIETTHVRDVTSSVREHGVEELTDRLAKRDVAGTVRTLRALLSEGEAPLRVLGFLAANLRRALHVVELAEGGVRADDIAGRLGMPSWLVQRSMGRGRAADLVRALHVLRRVDQDLKSAAPGDAVFETALVEIATTR